MFGFGAKRFSDEESLKGRKSTERWLGQSKRFTPNIPRAGRGR